MKFSDILALAKQGYTPSDIKELMALNTEEQQHDDPVAESPINAQVVDKEPALMKNEQMETAQSADDAKDESAERIQALENEIKRLKEENIRISRPMEKREEKPLDDQLADMARGFM